MPTPHQEAASPARNSLERSGHQVLNSAHDWYLVHTKPRQESLALANLERQGYECYMPLVKVEKIHRRKAGIFTVPLFPRYIFIHLDSSNEGQSWSPIRSTLGVNQMVHFGNRAAKVDDALMHALRLREQALPEQMLFQSGESVIVKDGPFAGIEAIYQTTNAERRAMILLEILSKPITVQIDGADLLKIE
jgi:transcriptional antiterminator RfaH